MKEILKKQIPLDTFILVDEINDHFIIDNLLKDIYENKNMYYQPTNVIGKHSDFKFLNENETFHNFLKAIKKQIFLIFKESFILYDSWSNIYNVDCYAKPHTHRGTTAFCGILYLTDGPGPGTYFKDYDLTIYEKKGRFVLFHGHLTHEVKKFDYTKDRVTIAFNCNATHYFDKDQQILLIK